MSAFVIMYILNNREGKREFDGEDDICKAGFDAEWLAGECPADRK
jgi:hypothetical protein